MALYDAFISYSHAKDKPIAAALQSNVQKLGKPWYRRRALRVFRDDTSLSATPSLWPAIEQALGQSRYLILLASPEAAASPWVGKEIGYWLEHKSVDTLLVALTDGELAWDEAAGDFRWPAATPLPSCLQGRFTAEPKWVDARNYRDGANPRDAKFTELAADFAAAVHGMPKEDLLSQELRQQRRALTLAWGAAVALLLLAGAALWQLRVALVAEQIATEQRHIAEQQTVIAKSEATRAERNFGAAKDTIDSVIFDLVEGLRNIQGMRTETVRRILERAEAAIGQLASRTENDPAVRRSQAVMYLLFSDTYLRLGATQLASDYARKALAINRAIVLLEPGNIEWRRDLSVNLNRLGDVLWEQGDLAGALEAHRESLDILRALAHRVPGGLDRDIAVTLNKIGDVLAARGDRSAALATYREALDLSRALAGREPNNPEWRRDVSVGLNKIGDLLVAQGDRDGALAAFRESLDIRRRLAASDPANMVWLRDVSVNSEPDRRPLGVARRSQRRAWRLSRGSRGRACARRHGPGEHDVAERCVAEPGEDRRRAGGGRRPQRRAGGLSGGARDQARAVRQGSRQHAMAARRVLEPREKSPTCCSPRATATARSPPIARRATSGVRSPPPSPATRYGRSTSSSRSPSSRSPTTIRWPGGARRWRSSSGSTPNAG